MKKPELELIVKNLNTLELIVKNLNTIVALQQCEINDLRKEIKEIKKNISM